MRVAGWLAGVALLALSGFAQEGWTRRAVAADTSAWRTVGATVVAEESRLTVRQEGEGNGFVLPRSAPPRREISVEADVTVLRRLGKGGWNFAGLTLWQDDANYWMLALVEGPEGSHGVDFVECQAGVWQAQSEPKTALKREGDVSFAWKTGAAYRLRLAFRDGKVCAEVADPADGRVVSAASYTLGDAQAVRSGRPGLIVHASVAECAGFSIGRREAAPGATVFFFFFAANRKRGVIGREKKGCGEKRRGKRGGRAAKWGWVRFARRAARARGYRLLSDFPKLCGLCGLCAEPGFCADAGRRQPCAGTNCGSCAMRLIRHRSLRMRATRATFLALPALTRRS